MRYYVGVDGGGTKTEIVWVAENGQVVHREILGSSNPNDIGAKQVIENMVSAILKDIPADAERVDISLGLSGLTFSGCKDALVAALAKIEKVEFIDVCSDVQIALDAVYDGDGCIVICGTGSVGYLRKNGKHILVGGGGYMIDSLLSGFDLGKEAINAVYSEFDGRGEKTLLTELFSLHTENKNIQEILRNVYVKGKAYVASFSPLVIEAYEKGDAVAEKIIQKRTAEFETLLMGIYKASGQDICEITVFGGLSRRWDIFYSFLSKNIKDKMRFFISKTPVVYGAVKRARRGNERDFMSTFLETYKK